MKALCIVYEEVHDQAAFEEYRRAVMPTLEPYGAKFLVRGGKFTVLEGDMDYTQVAVIEFPSREAAEGWYQSDAYQAVIPIRLNAARCQLIIVDGMAGA